MNRRITEDTLTLYYYEDGLTAAERRDVEAALSADPELAERFRALCSELELFVFTLLPKAADRGACEQEQECDLGNVLHVLRS